MDCIINKGKDTIILLHSKLKCIFTFITSEVWLQIVVLFCFFFCSYQFGTTLNVQKSRIIWHITHPSHPWVASEWSCIALCCNSTTKRCILIIHIHTIKKVKFSLKKKSLLSLVQYFFISFSCLVNYQRTKKKIFLIRKSPLYKIRSKIP